MDKQNIWNSFFDDLKKAQKGKTTNSHWCGDTPPKKDNKQRFVDFCEQYRKRRDDLDILYEKGIDVDTFMETTFNIENELLYSMFDEHKVDMIFDWLYESWNGEMQMNDKTIKITSDEELYDYLNQ